MKDRKAFLTSLLFLGNPFLNEDSSLVHIVSKHALSKALSESVKSAKEIGKQQYEAFVTARPKTGSASWCDNIQNNNLALFWYKNDIDTSKSKQKIISLNSERELYADLFVACQAKEEDLENFFAHTSHCSFVI